MIFENPVITYNVLLPGIDQICPLKFHDDDIYIYMVYHI